MAKSVGVRNRSAEAKAKGKKTCMFEISQELDSLIERVRDAIAAEIGSCTRVQALERMGREGAKKLLRRPRGKFYKRTRNGLDKVKSIVDNVSVSGE